ncbi:MAG: proline dehydrogenase family protein [Actinomycetota bacterium]|nr:proline dehydrogenase family protein [Actinomycetota bacterium]
MASRLDDQVSALARRIAELEAGEEAGVYKMSRWSELVLRWAMSHPSFKTQLFRFVDVFPATRGDADVLRHVQEYFGDTDVPRLLEHGVHAAGSLPLGGKVSAAVARRNIERMARQFIVGHDAATAVEGLHRLWRQGSAFTVDLLGEKTVSEKEADRYAARLAGLLDALLDATARWAPDDHLERDDVGALPRANVSMKPTALSSMYSPLTRQEGLAQARSRLRPVLETAAERGAFVWFDMEHYDAKDLTLELFRDLVGDRALSGLQAGVVVQAYLKDSYRDLEDLIAWAAGTGRQQPIGIRLVKGAYWDTETVAARAEGWPLPVFEDKAQTDANFERCVRLLHDHHGTVRAAFGSHNLRSLACAVVEARSRGIPDDGYEIQMLYGMAEPVQAAIRRLGLRLRVYAPVGELVPGMAYLVRRLLENTSNESFVRHRFAEKSPLDELVAPAHVDELAGPEPPARPPATDASRPGPYAHEPVAEWRRGEVRAGFAAAVRASPSSFPAPVPAVIGGERVTTARSIESVDPADPDTVVATSASCGPAEADAAVDAARQAVEEWRRAPARRRAAVLFGAAEWMRARRDELAALQVHEAGKPWPEADADVCEAIDFCEYYGREMLRLDRGGPVQSPPGEANRLSYQAKGVGVVIGPWNFPLAIPTGMVTAALVTGNAVLLKPAEQTPAVAYQLVRALEAGGLPEGVLGFLPGVGEEVGAHLVQHPEVAFVVFTGSKAVGLRINRDAAVPRPGQGHVKRVVAEMGGKNAVVVDADADVDQAVPAIASSAFGYAGQKCSAASRLVVVGAGYDEVVDRLVAHARELRVGHPREMSVRVGPLIDAEAWKRVRGYVERAPADGTVVLARDDVPDVGYFVGPTIVEDVAPGSPLGRDEVFGPVLTVFRAGDLDEALAIANDTDYALTAGLFSRSPSHIARASAELRAGNVYVNRGITGAVVGRQPFGGYGLSGVGSKAGGPDYLLQFVDPRTVTENTVRQGFAPS